ncbi:DapH/DapD/GlmU-related protein [Secundilactobacillus folii]|nr:DapH/DapD/GlmU-related protein [Secundilactobacillus folii]
MKVYDMNSETYQDLQLELDKSQLNCFQINTSTPNSAAQQEAYDQLFAHQLPKDSTVTAPTYIDRASHVHIGNHVFINHNLTTIALGGIYIGDNVQIAPNVSLITANHDIQQMNILNTAPIHVEAGAWIGTKAVILPSVTIGAGTIIGAGAVVTKDIPAHSVAVGNPAKVIKKLTLNEED